MVEHLEAQFPVSLYRAASLQHLADNSLLGLHFPGQETRQGYMGDWIDGLGGWATFT